MVVCFSLYRFILKKKTAHRKCLQFGAGVLTGAESGETAAGCCSFDCPPQTGDFFKKTKHLISSRQPDPTRSFFSQRQPAMSITRLETWAVGLEEGKMPHGPLHHRQCASSGHPKRRITKKCRGSASDGWSRCCWFSWSAVPSSSASISSTSRPSSSAPGRRPAMLAAERASTGNRWTPRSAPWCCRTPTSSEPSGDTGSTSWGGKCHVTHFGGSPSPPPVCARLLCGNCKKKKKKTKKKKKKKKAPNNDTCCLQNAQGMADGESFPNRSVAAQARNCVYSRGYLRRRQVEHAKGNAEPPPPPTLVCKPIELMMMMMMMMMVVVVVLMLVREQYTDAEHRPPSFCATQAPRGCRFFFCFFFVCEENTNNSNSSSCSSTHPALRKKNTPPPPGNSQTSITGLSNWIHHVRKKKEEAAAQCCTSLKKGRNRGCRLQNLH